MNYPVVGSGKHWGGRLGPPGAALASPVGHTPAKPVQHRNTGHLPGWDHWWSRGPRREDRTFAPGPVPFPHPSFVSQGATSYQGTAERIEGCMNGMDLTGTDVRSSRNSPDVAQGRVCPAFPRKGHPN